MKKHSSLGGRILSAMMAVTIAAGMFATGVVSAAGGYWNETDEGWRYLESNGRPVVNRFANIDGHWYSFDQDGIMQTGWYNLPDSDIWYYFQKDGSAVIENWACVNGLWYYFDAAGYMVTGWQKIDETWYYFYDNGALKTGWLYRDGKWYYLTADGVMKRGWLLDNGKWYYLLLDGSMATDCTLAIGDVEYSFDINGVWWVSGEATEEEIEEITPDVPENSTDIDEEESDPEPTESFSQLSCRLMAEAVAAACEKRPVPETAVTSGYLQSTLVLDRSLIDEFSGLMNEDGSMLYLVLKAKDGCLNDLLIQLNVARRMLVNELDGTASKVWSQGGYIALMVLDDRCKQRDDELQIAASAFDDACQKMMGTADDSNTTSETETDQTEDSQAAE